MTIKHFFTLAQMQTTVTTFLTALFGIVYAWYNYQVFRPILSLFAILLVLLFLMAINIRDNYVDYQVASQKGSSSAEEMVIGRENLAMHEVQQAYLGLGVLSVLIIFFLTTQTTIYLLYAAAGAVLIGVLYAAGPLPISSTPTGEIFTGIAMGFAVFFATFYVNTFDVLRIDGKAILELLLGSMPTTICAINIVLANNICDVEEDVEDNRFTLPYYLGRRKALTLFRILYYIAYLSVIPSVLLGIYPGITLLSLFSFPFIEKNIQKFMKDQEKERGLRLAVINSVILPLAILLPFIVAIWVL